MSLDNLFQSRMKKNSKRAENIMLMGNTMEEIINVK